ncbi:MAG TPA: SdpI family protein [Chitinophagaceae bacterium]
MKKILTTVAWVIFFIPGIYLFATWKNLPASIPMHYNLDGEVDRFGNKNELALLVLILTVVNIGVYLLLTNVHRIDPKKYGLENKDRMQRMAITVSVFIAALQCVFIYSSVNNVTDFIPGIIFSGVGLLFSFLGNYMYNIKPNYFAGFRLPWTLENETNWKKTHQLAGKLWFTGGILIALISLFLSFKTSVIIFLIITAILVIIPAVYSYRMYKKQKMHGN